MSSPKIDPGSVMRVRSRWDYVKKKLRRRGVVEVDKSHPHHDMLSAIKTAIRKLLTEHPEACAKANLQAEDFSQKIKISIPSPSGKTYQFTSYASPVFACLRAAVSINEEDFLHSLSPEGLEYLEFISNSRSGQDFYFSNNQRFILKTDKHHCIQYFLSILPEYLSHFHTYPHSLLVKFLGLYSVKMSRFKKKYFLVMQSIFWPTVRLDERFDIKGCLANRYQNPNPSGEKTILVLKDQNFLDQKIHLGLKREWFLKQLRADIDFLVELQVQDYSLLLGRHPVDISERRESVGTLVLRMKKSFGNEKARLKSTDAAEDYGAIGNKQTDTTSTSHIHADAESPAHCSKDFTEEINSCEMSELNHDKTDAVKKNSVSPFKERNVTFLQSFSDKEYLDSTGLKFQNRRLLLNSDNSLHIIDGEGVRYYIGVIDFFTQFQCHQRVAKFLKDLKTCCGNHSTVPPNQYAERFYEFITERVV